MKQKTVFCCTECGNETPNWAGKCPACGAWNTLKEVQVDAKPKGRGASAPSATVSKSPKLLSTLDA